MNRPEEPATEHQTLSEDSCDAEEPLGPIVETAEIWYAPGAVALDVNLTNRG